MTPLLFDCKVYIFAVIGIPIHTTDLITLTIKVPSIKQLLGMSAPACVGADVGLGSSEAPGGQDPMVDAFAFLLVVGMPKGMHVQPAFVFAVQGNLENLTPMMEV